MSNNKLLYEAPVAETFVVRFEGKIMQGSTNVSSNSNSFGDTNASVVDASEADWWD